ncbi:MAG: hypothetical protein IPM54_07085 [Polyangiaceae bacterium]|nr:hypothetical protein [Polyangiaceae bacterium]
MAKPLLGFSAPLAVAVLLTGCGNYTSDYVPPKDGRARAVWDKDRVVASLPDDANNAACSAAIYDVQEDPTRYRTYYGGSTNIIIWRPWIVVTGSNRVAASPSTGPRAPATASVRGGGGSSGGSVGSTGSSGGSSGGGGGGDIGKAAVVLVVVAMLTLPFITLGLGLGRPEPSKEVAEEIDKVNAYNDLARLSGSPCAVAGAK